MVEISSKKTEQKAITKVEELINNIETADSNISKNDKTISWDGTIDFYNGTIDKKENYSFSVDVQVKGRTTLKKKLEDKSTFDLEITDLKNYAKKDGTLFLLVKFKANTDEYKIYYLDLLPYNIARLLKSVENSSIKKVKIKMKEIKNSDHLEEICRNFQINKDIQKRMNPCDLLNDNVTMNSDMVTKFNVWEKDITKFCPENLVGTYQYIYLMDKDNHPIGINYSMIFNMSKQLNQPVMTIDKSIIYNDLTYSKSTTSDIYTFGKAFTINNAKKTFNIQICGTLKERIQQLSFIKCISNDKKFLIGESEFKLDDDISNIDNFIELESKYNEFKKVLEKHNITKDINLDLWTPKDFEQFNIWMNAIEFGNKIKLQSDTSLIGYKAIQDLKLSIIASRGQDGLFKVDSIWNCEKKDRYHFKIVNDNQEILTDNLFLNLNEESYYSDDLNINEMIEVISKYNFSKEEYQLLNFQVLDVIKAYDKTNNGNLLYYALFLTNLLLEKDSGVREVYYVNYCQILKRTDKLTQEEIEKLIEIRESTDKLDIKLCCNALMDNKVETSILLNKLDNDTKDILKGYPISKYIFN